MAAINFLDIPSKDSSDEKTNDNMIVFKKINNNYVSFKTRLLTFEKFFINPTLINKMRESMVNFQKDINNIISKIPNREYVDLNFLSKNESNYQKSRILTEDRLNTLLGNYCTVEKIEIDIRNCKEHSRAVATSIANSLATTAAIAKSSNAQTQGDSINTNSVIAAMSSPSNG